MTKKEFKEMIKYLNKKASKGCFLCISIDGYISGYTSSYTEARDLFDGLFQLNDNWIASDYLKERCGSDKNEKLVRYILIDIFEKICLDTEIYKDW